MKYQKPHTSHTQQIKTLEERGLCISDYSLAEHYLSIIGYYRLSSYCYRFEAQSPSGMRTHKILSGTKFEDIINIYVFDQKLRSLMLEALERFEICARAIWAYELSSHHGSHPHMEETNFSNHEEYVNSLENLKIEIKRAQGNTEEICHYFKKYSEPDLPPIWTTVAVMSFGELFRWIKNTKNPKVKNNLAKFLGMPNTKTFEGVSRVLTTVRNICAHQGRLWDRRLNTRLPYIKRNLKVPMGFVKSTSGNVSDCRMFNVVVIMAHIMVAINADTSWPNKVATLVSKLSKREQEIMGFPDNWEENEFWRLTNHSL